MDNHFDFIFKNQNIDISFDDNGTAWFQGPQIASILGYSHSPNMYKMLSPNEIMTVRNVNSHSGQRGGAQMMNLINEYGLYRLITLSRRPEATEFQNWLFRTILPSIRRYGAYIDPQTRQVLEADPNLIHNLNHRIVTLEDQNALLAYSADMNNRRATYLGGQADQYRARALQFQDVVQEIDDYSMMDSASEFQRIVRDILDDADTIKRLARNIKSQLYHVVDKSKG